MFTDEEKEILDDIVYKIEQNNISPDEIAIAISALNQARNQIIYESFKRFTKDNGRQA